MWNIRQFLDIDFIGSPDLELITKSGLYYVSKFQCVIVLKFIVSNVR